MASFYFGLLGELTPPVAISAFTAAAIAGANPMAASWQAMRIGLAIYLLPIAFLYSPELLMMGNAWEICIAVARACSALVLMAAATSGALFRPLGIPQRAGLMAAGPLMLFPLGLGWNLAGMLMALGIIAANRLAKPVTTPLVASDI